MKQEENKSVLRGKKIVILGGSSGLGFATAKAAVAEGAKVIIVSSNQQRIDKALQGLSPDSEGYALDLGEETNIREFFSTIGNFDHLVYTAGENIELIEIKDLEVEAAREYFNLRYWGAFTAVKCAAPLLNQGGSITLTGGIAAARPGSGWSLGASICAAMEGFSRAMAVELAPIRVNLVSPGVIRTNLWDNMEKTERDNFYNVVGNSLLVKRVGEAEDLAKAYIFLMTQPFATGQVLTVDGGAVLV